MTDSIVSVPPTTSAAQVAETLLKHRIHRLFVVEDGTLQGVVSAFDLLRLIKD
ncbi:MAG: CBS domain-containing protein [Deltaproteobacteria bacterium]|nr:CBS domain-containing protein [Deltaproteobacteria bacterium]